jgi:hypothetical protein
MNELCAQLNCLAIYVPRADASPDSILRFDD